jgi:hypothetical protein
MYRSWGQQDRYSVVNLFAFARNFPETHTCLRDDVRLFFEQLRAELTAT